MTPTTNSVEPTTSATDELRRLLDERGECRMDYLCDGYLYFKSYWCRECDERFAYRLIGHDDALPNYCPNCGRKAVDE